MRRPLVKNVTIIRRFVYSRPEAKLTQFDAHLPTTNTQLFPVNYTMKVGDEVLVRSNQHPHRLLYGTITFIEPKGRYPIIVVTKEGLQYISEEEANAFKNDYQANS